METRAERACAPSYTRTFVRWARTAAGSVTAGFQMVHCSPQAYLLVPPKMYVGDSGDVASLKQIPAAASPGPVSLSHCTAQVRVRFD